MRAAVGADSNLAQRLRVGIDRVLPELWDPVDGFEWGPDESEFVDVDPPHNWWLPAKLAEAENIESALRTHLENVPARWRLDIAMALVVYLTLDLPDSVADDSSVN